MACVYQAESLLLLTLLWGSTLLFPAWGLQP
jgi:hypothetical protein